MKIEIKYYKAFKKDFQLAKKRKNDLNKLKVFVYFLMNDLDIPKEYKEHPLKGNYDGFLECHLESDWLLIYKKYEKEKVVYLYRLGTHSDLFD